MNVSLLNPDGVFKPDTYYQVAIGTGSKIVCLSGQVAIDERGHVVGEGDLAAQAEQAYRNVFHALAGAGASFEHVVKVTAHLAHLQRDFAGYDAVYSARVGEPWPVRTTVGSDLLLGMLVEVDLVAVVQEDSAAASR